MKRERLIWFALGAATSAFGVLFALLLLPQASKRSPYLAISDRPFEEDELNRIEEIPSTSAQLLWDCEAEEFFIKSSNGADGVPYTLVEIALKNERAFHCVFERATSEGFRLHVHMLTNQEAKTL